MGGRQSRPLRIVTSAFIGQQAPIAAGTIRKKKEDLNTESNLKIAQQQKKVGGVSEQRLPPLEEELQESGKNSSFEFAFERFKRSADAFDIPKFPKRMRTDLSGSNSSLEKLFKEKTKAKIISWRRNTRSLTDQIAMSS